MQDHAQSSNWYHVLAFLSLAAGLGLACGIALGGVALLLAAPAYGAQPAEPGEGALILSAEARSPATGQERIQAPLISTDVAFQVTGSVAHARVVQTFRNPGGDWQEGVYLFPVPENAAVDRLLLRAGERVTEAVVNERAGGFLAATFADIGSQETVVVELDYQQPLQRDDNRFSPRFPMVVAPRHVRMGPL